MTFLRDYVSSEHSWLSSSGLAIVLATGLIIGNYSSSKFEESPPKQEYGEHSGIDALIEMSEIYNRGVSIEGGNIMRDTSSINAKYIVSDWMNLPKEGRYEVLTSLIEIQMRETGYDVRDFTRDNIGDAMFFMLGGGLQ